MWFWSLQIDQLSMLSTAIFFYFSYKFPNTFQWKITVANKNSSLTFDKASALLGWDGNLVSTDIILGRFGTVSKKYVKLKTFTIVCFFGTLLFLGVRDLMEYFRPFVRMKNQNHQISHFHQQNTQHIILTPWHRWITPCTLFESGVIHHN